MPSVARLSWRGTNAFVTGAGGFIGGWVCDRLLSDGAHVTALVEPTKAKAESTRRLASKGAHTVLCRVEHTRRIRSLLELSGSEVIFHLAANNDNLGIQTSPLRLFETNIRGVWSVLDACIRLPRIPRIVLGSSSEATSAEYSADGQGERRPMRAYAVSKLAAEHVAGVYCDFYGLPVAIARCENVYGGGDLNWNRLIPGTIRSILRGEAPVLRSDGALLRDYVYVADVVDAYLRLAARAGDPDVRGRVFHLGTGTRTSATDVVTYLCEAAGTQFRPIVSSRASLSERVTPEYDAERPSRVLGWEPSTELRQGLRQTFEWYRTNLNDGRPDSRG